MLQPTCCEKDYRHCLASLKHVDFRMNYECKL